MFFDPAYLCRFKWSEIDLKNINKILYYTKTKIIKSLLKIIRNKKNCHKPVYKNNK
jgi:hypothetical protein